MEKQARVAARESDGLRCQGKPVLPSSCAGRPQPLFVALCLAVGAIAVSGGSSVVSESKAADSLSCGGRRR